MNNRFMELEGLRGIAAIVVVIYHFFLLFYLFSFFGSSSATPVQHAFFENHLYANPLTGILSGTFAVAIFFVLSGFVLSIGFFQTGKIEIVKKLASKRYIRLMLPALVSILISYALIKIGLSHIQLAASLTHSSILSAAWAFPPKLLDAIVGGVFGIFVGVPNLYNGVTWTMSIEFVGSFIVFGTLLLSTRTRFQWIVYMALLLVTFNTWFFGFIVGMILADLYSSGVIRQQIRNIIPVGLMLILAIYLGGYPFGDDLGGTWYAIFRALPFASLNYQMVSTTLGAGLIVFIVLWAGQVANLLRHKKISSIGKYTFSLYLIHAPIIYSFTAGVFVIAQYHMSYNRAVLLSFLVSIPVIWIATILFEKYIDKKSMAFATYCSDLYFGKRTLELREKISSVNTYISKKIKSLDKK